LAARATDLAQTRRPPLLGATAGVRSWKPLSKLPPRQRHAPLI
jgi:hypothetical protein